MKNLRKFFTLFLIFITSKLAHAENIKIKIPFISGKIITNNLDLTDWQTSLTCHFTSPGPQKEIVRLPHTYLNKIEGNIYSLKIKASAIIESLPHFDIQNCAYKLILIGKNSTTHQNAYGEIILLGKDNGVMNENELLVMQDLNYITKILNEKTKELVISFGKDGGIVENI